MLVPSRIACTAAFGVAFWLAAPLHAAEVTDVGQGPVTVARDGSGATGLSGISYAGGNRFFAVSDRRGRLFSLEIEIHRSTGFVASTRIERTSKLAFALDAEGIAYSGGDTVFVCDERGPALREHRIDDGSVVEAFRLPPIFANARWNMSLEGLARGPDGAVWLANEETLRVDGAIATETSGSIVRIQRFDRSHAPAGQWAYVTDPTPGGPLAGFERSGLADLAVLPDGTLLVLERAVGVDGLRSRIYEVDTANATDTSKIRRLADTEFTPVAKRRLWEGVGMGDNYEGLAVGVKLESGDWSLLLLSDDGGVTLPRLYPLSVRIGARSSSNLPK